MLQSLIHLLSDSMTWACRALLRGDVTPAPVDVLLGLNRGGSPAADLAPVGVGGVLEEALVAAAARGATAVVVISWGAVACSRVSLKEDIDGVTQHANVMTSRP